MEEIVRDPSSTTRSVYDLAGNAEDAAKRANDDKQSARVCLGEKK